MQNVKTTVVRPTKAVFDHANPQAYGKFIVFTCTMNNSLGHLKGDYYLVTELEAESLQEELYVALTDPMTAEEREKLQEQGKLGGQAKGLKAVKPNSPQKNGTCC